MRLTASRLELYDRSGKGDAANAISAAVTRAAKSAIRSIGRRYVQRDAVAAITLTFYGIVYPVLSEHRELGACDSEPRRAALSELVSRVAKRYKLSEWEQSELYYEV